MKLNSFRDGIPVIETEKIEARRIYSSEKTNAIQINLQSGAVVETHTTEEDVFFLALEGCAEICINGEAAEISKGQIAECRGGIEKGLTNKSDSLFSVLVVKMEKY